MGSVTHIRAWHLLRIRKLLKKMGAAPALIAETMATARSHDVAQLKRDLRMVEIHYRRGIREGGWAVEPEENHDGEASTATEKPEA